MNDGENTVKDHQLFPDSGPVQFSVECSFKVNGQINFHSKKQCRPKGRFCDHRKTSRNPKAKRRDIYKQ